jgi:hypothetical protein
VRFYSRDAIRKVREERERRDTNPKRVALSLADVPVDAEYEDPDAVLHVWNGEKWIPWEKWRATAPIAREGTSEVQP